MTPYYEDTMVRLYQGDARHLPLADASVHLVVTSPPYNARVRYDGYADWLPWEQYWHGLLTPSLRECYRVLAPGGRLCLNIANVVRQDVAEAPPGANGRPWAKLLTPLLWTLLEEIGFLPREQLTWIKADLPNDAVVCNSSTAWGSWCSAQNPVLRAIAEPVLIASKGSYAREPGTSDLTRAEFMAWTRNAWFIPTGHAARQLDHPAMFPPELPRRLIKLYSYTTDTILDPFGGSGTTVRAAKDLGRQGIGVDVSARYCAMAADRCRQMVLPLEAS